MPEKMHYSSFLELVDDRPEKTQDASDLRDGSVYEWSTDLRLATEVALVTGRPLLLKGEPGGGKSSWAAYVARNLDWWYLEFVVSGKTQPQDLLYHFDLLQRLNDAQAQQIKPNPAYVVPGMLWWAINPATAARYQDDDAVAHANPFPKINAGRKGNGAVLLIDEIDKADPDVPNGLLVPLGSQTFTVPETGWVVESASSSKQSSHRLHSPLVIFTTNGERALPQAFLRRCIVYELGTPDPDLLVKVATKHFGDKGVLATERLDLATKLAQKFMALRDASRQEGFRLPGIAEYLDALRACIELGITTTSPQWELIEQISLKKEKPRVV
jgi:MoxR-like ATPase